MREVDRTAGDTADRLGRIDEACDRFEDEWRAGRRPQVAAFASDREPDRAALVAALVRVDLDYRRRAGERPTPADYPPPLVALPGVRELFAEPAGAALVVLDPPARVPLAGRTRLTVGRVRSADVPIRNPSCSRQQFELHWVPVGWQLVPVSVDSPTLRNGKRVATAVLLSPGDRIAAGGTEFVFEDPTDPPPSVAEPSRPDAGRPDQRTLRAEDVRLSPADRAWHGEPTPVGAGLLVGRDATAGLVLDHPLVSRRHARIAARGGSAVVTDLVSANGTFVNGRRVVGATLLAAGDRIDIGPYTLRFTGTHLAPSSRAGNVELRGWRLSRTVTERSTGRPLTLLDDVSLVVRPGQFVCLMGPSGSGKSTLLAALSGRARPDRGLVLVNDADLYAAFDAVKRDLAVVPQKDLLFGALTVAEALTYTARLRLPPDSTTADVRREVDELLVTVGLVARRDIPIRQLSGGQLKRVSLANELIGRPSLIFLDEVTSGLDEQTDRDMMTLFRAMADAGKTVVCVTHSLAHVDRACHAVAVLAPGGVLAFAGTPAEAKAHFGTERLGDIYEALAARPADEWRARFEDHPNAAPPPLAANPVDTGPEPSRGATRLRTAARQGRVLLRRRLALLLRDRPAVLTLAGQTAVVSVALAVAFGDLSRVADPLAQARDAVTLYFLLAVSSFWFGCNGSVKVLVGDRPMYARERAVNLSPWGYGGATFLLFAAIAAAQAAVLAGVAWLACGPPGMGWPTVAALALAAVTGSALGLALSAASYSEEQAVAAVPLALIPQIVFGGAIVALGGLSAWVAKVGITVYWVHRAVVSQLPADVAAAAGVAPAGYGSAVAATATHGFLFAAAAAAVVLYRDARVSRR